MAKLTEEMKAMMAAQQAFVATASPDGKPDVGPKGSARVRDDSHIVFFELVGGRTWENIQKNPRVAIAVADRTKVQGFRFEGRVEELMTSGPLYEQAKGVSTMLKMPVPPKAAVIVEIEEIYDLGKGGAKVS